MVICHHIARVARHGEARAVEGVFAAYGHNAHRARPRVQHGARHALRAEGRARQQARQLRAMFSQYVPPEVVSRLLAQPELLRLGGEAREVTLLFTDLAGFTTLSEHFRAEQTL